MVHLLPFQRSASVLFSVVPTVMQAVPEVHETTRGASRTSGPPPAEHSDPAGDRT
jgi:hypothetical protein